MIAFLRRAALATACLLASLPAFAETPLVYRISFPAPQHHVAEVDVTFTDLPSGPLEARISRSSPGRYALHEFAKNVFDLQAYDAAGHALTIDRPNPHQWNIVHPGSSVRVTYKVFGNRVDGTYLGIDASHAHLNMPALMLWARGLERRPIRVTFAVPAESNWKVATQLFPTPDPWTFTAPNLQYLMDSPTELSDHDVRSFTVGNPDGKTFTIVTAVHHDATAADVDEYVAHARKIVLEHGAIFGEFPEFDTGTYIFLGDYVPWGGGDGMEHRNSTVVAEGTSIRGSARSVMGTVAHEFFHAWNVERIRPRSLEPFNFEDANISGELWLAEGFTQYYGELVMARAGLSGREQTMMNLADSALTIATNPAHRFRSVVDISRMAPFTDGAAFNDPTNFSYTFINYYPYGASLALALDLRLRQRSHGTVTLDDYMRAMWRVHGKPAAAQPGYVANPYSLADARARLAEISDPAFANDFFAKYIEGREVPDYASLLAPAGVIVRKRNPGAAWSGVSIDSSGRVGATQGLVPWGSPAFDAGLEDGDVIVSVDGRRFSPGVLTNRKPGDTVRLEIRRAGAVSERVTLTFAEDPSLQAIPVERTGKSLSAEQQAFRDAWLGSKRR